MDGVQGVPVSGETTVTLKRGGTLRVRRLRRSEMNAVYRAAGLKLDVGGGEINAGELLQLQELMARKAIVGAEGGPVEEGGGVATPWKQDEHGTLGKIAAVAIYDALADEDLAAVLEAANGKLGEGPVKN